MIRFFAEIKSGEFKKIGGKASSLCKLLQHGFEVPNGFVIFAKDFDVKELSRAFDKLGSRYVAVRSSANLEDGQADSFAGQFETFLCVDREHFIQKVEECFESLKSERIQNYCLSKGIQQDKIYVAVIVQAMVDADVAGVAFTKHPVTQDKGVVIIEAAYGLGEAVVSGMVTPDTYIIEKGSLSIYERNILSQEKKIVLDQIAAGTMTVAVPENLRERPKLSDSQLIEIASVALKIEQCYGKPMDIEWALKGQKLFILQARPITT